jgi:hypothetical protein
MKQVPSEILEATSHCNKDLLKTIYSPSYSWTSEVKEPSQWEIDCLSQFKNENEQFTCWMSGTDYLENKPAYKLEWHSSENSFREFKNKYWTHSTGNTVPPLWFQLIPQASASEKEQLSNTATVKSVEKKPRTPLEIYEQVKHLGYRKEPAISLISTCKVSSHDPRHCILVWLTLMYNEAGNQQNSKACIDRNNCFGIQSWKKKYSSLDEGSENWVQKYNKWWINVKSAKDFYPDLWKVSKTRYCYSEIQYHPSIGCPDGQKIATDKWNKLKSIIY